MEGKLLNQNSVFFFHNQPTYLSQSILTMKRNRCKNFIQRLDEFHIVVSSFALFAPQCITIQDLGRLTTLLAPGWIIHCPRTIVMEARLGNNLGGSWRICSLALRGFPEQHCSIAQSVQVSNIQLHWMRKLRNAKSPASVRLFV